MIIICSIIVWGIFTYILSNKIGGFWKMFLFGPFGVMYQLASKIEMIGTVLADKVVPKEDEVKQSDTDQAVVGEVNADVIKTQDGTASVIIALIMLLIATAIIILIE